MRGVGIAMAMAKEREMAMNEGKEGAKGGASIAGADGGGTARLQPDGGAPGSTGAVKRGVWAQGKGGCSLALGAYILRAKAA